MKIFEPSMSNASFDIFPTAPEGIMLFEPKGFIPEGSKLSESVIEKASNRLSNKLDNAKEAIGGIGIIDNMDKEDSAYYLMNRSQNMDKAWSQAIMEKYSIDPKSEAQNAPSIVSSLNGLKKKIAPTYNPSKR